MRDADLLNMNDWYGITLDGDTDAFASDDNTKVMDIFSERLRNAVRRMSGTPCV